MNERAVKIKNLYPDLSDEQAADVDEFLVQKCDKIFGEIQTARMVGHKPEMIVSLLLAYVHNNIEGLAK